MLEILNWNNNLLTGSIPAEIGQLRDLKILSMAVNNLWGTIPSTISNISTLEGISLSYNSLKGNIPKEIDHNHMLLQQAPLTTQNLDLICKFDSITTHYSSHSTSVEVYTTLSILSMKSKNALGLKVLGILACAMVLAKSTPDEQ
ncbi:hypothetical protein L6164_037298 [Bauhinia variegata]|uniref:Uncharacterized protein n=1 Tax=Bauhinia variegata TaxID=167791 RepID=A0ACB9KJS3_BAUVA|nr:hypothetical protein L6164_037298 [Bauhinia variegata]